MDIFNTEPFDVTFSELELFGVVFSSPLWLMIPVLYQFVSLSASSESGMLLDTWQGFCFCFCLGIMALLHYPHLGLF